MRGLAFECRNTRRSWPDSNTLCRRTFSTEGNCSNFCHLYQSWCLCHHFSPGEGDFSLAVAVVVAVAVAALSSISTPHPYRATQQQMETALLLGQVISFFTLLLPIPPLSLLLKDLKVMCNSHTAPEVIQFSTQAMRRLACPLLREPISMAQTSCSASGACRRLQGGLKF